jgi:hypothetical protein
MLLLASTALLRVTPLKYLVGVADYTALANGSDMATKLPVGAQKGDLCAIVLTANADLDSVSLANSGWTGATYDIAHDGNQYDTWIGYKLLEAADLASNVISNSNSNQVASIFIFRGLASLAVTAVGGSATPLANGTDYSDATPVAGHKAGMGLFATRGQTFATAVEGPPWVSNTLNGSASAHSYELYPYGDYDGAVATFENIQNCAQWSAFRIDLD